jgi:hypothetical protein
LATRSAIAVGEATNCGKNRNSLIFNFLNSKKTYRVGWLVGVSLFLFFLKMPPLREKTSFQKLHFSLPFGRFGAAFFPNLLHTMRFFLLVFLGLTFAASHLAAQTSPTKKSKPSGKLSAKSIEQLHASEDTLAVLAYAVVNDSIEAERFAACRQLITNLVRTLKIENSYKYPFDRLKSISILAPPDSSFRIFTWQLFVNDSTYRYYGAIQRNTRDLQLTPLVDRSFEMERPTPVSEVLPADRWYGALYYNLRQFDTPQGRQYLLMGFDAYQFFEKRKIVEVLSFDNAGKPAFGAAVFERETPPRNGPEMRLILQYSAEASVRCNWDEEYQMVLFEHLIPMGSPFGNYLTMVPDGSYDGLKLEKGRWKFISKVFNDVQDEAPTVVPVLNKEKDVIGRDKPKRGRQ